MQIYGRLAAMVLAVALACGLTAGTAPAQTVTVVVNGSGVSFDQPPVERAGRVFVPLRGVFERLGASVVYANGVINATGNGRNVHLTIGSTQATVNGQTVMMDVAPFLVGARTLVPLRFVAQALGAAVNWSQSNNTVYIQGGSGASAYVPPSNASFSLRNERPAVSTGTTTPAIHASFSEPVDRNTLRVAVDGRDVTALVYANANGFDVTPNFTLYPGTHRVRVSGTTQAGATFDTGWTFTTRAGAAGNVINNLSPTPGSQVSGTFTLAGHTRPGSHVHIVATGTATALGGLFQIGTGTFQTDVTADGAGNFSIPISVNAPSGGTVRLIITSTAPNGASVERNITYAAG